MKNAAVVHGAEYPWPRGAVNRTGRLLQKNAKAAGSLRISFRLQTNGRLSQVVVKGGQALSGLIPCIKAKVARWHLGAVPKALSYGPFVVRFAP